MFFELSHLLVTTQPGLELNTSDTVVRETLVSLAIALKLSPFDLSQWIFSVSTDALGRPSFFPFSLALLSPVLSLSDESAQQYEGRWAVSFAPVADSRFVVLIQQRYAPAVPWEVWFLVTLILIAIFLTLAIRYVYRISRPSESYE